MLLNSANFLPHLIPQKTKRYLGSNRLIWLRWTRWLCRHYLRWSKGSCASQYICVEYHKISHINPINKYTAVSVQNDSRCPNYLTHIATTFYEHTLSFNACFVQWQDPLLGGPLFLSCHIQRPFLLLAIISELQHSLFTPKSCDYNNLISLIGTACSDPTMEGEGWE